MQKRVTYPASYFDRNERTQISVFAKLLKGYKVPCTLNPIFIYIYLYIYIYIAGIYICIYSRRSTYPASYFDRA